MKNLQRELARPAVGRGRLINAGEGRQRVRTLFLVTAVVGLTSITAAADVTAPPGTPTAVASGRVRAVGPLFFGDLAEGHSCSASVVHSLRYNLVLTAAHCISGTGAGIRFAPGYVNGTTPWGVWTSTRVWLDPSWISSQDPQHDFAFLQIAPQRIDGRVVNVEEVAGANLLGFAPRSGATVTGPAYPAGVNDTPITCTTTIIYTSGYPTFNCHGYVGGTSGSPFLLARHGRPTFVVGVIGGLHQGGCYDWNSFSSAFSIDTYRTYLRALLGRAADIAPMPGGDGC